MQQKKKLIFILLFIFCCISLPLYFRPRPLFNAGTDSITRIIYNDVEITDRAICQEVIQLLMDYKYRATFEKVEPYLMQEVAVEIDGRCNNKPLHIVLGTNNFLYEHGGGIKYIIIDGNDLLDKIEGIFNNC